MYLILRLHTGRVCKLVLRMVAHLCSRYYVWLLVSLLCTVALYGRSVRPLCMAALYGCFALLTVHPQGYLDASIFTDPMQQQAQQAAFEASVFEQTQREQRYAEVPLLPLGYYFSQILLPSCSVCTALRGSCSVSACALAAAAAHSLVPLSAFVFSPVSEAIALVHIFCCILLSIVCLHSKLTLC